MSQKLKLGLRRYNSSPRLRVPDPDGLAMPERGTITPASPVFSERCLGFRLVFFLPEGGKMAIQYQLRESGEDLLCFQFKRVSLFVP